jgi:hypothetical protein
VEGQEDTKMKKEEILRALDLSIKKWEDILAGTESDEGSDNCALCYLFVREACIGCPVREYTGYKFCDESPYDEWRDLECDTIYNTNGNIDKEAVNAAYNEAQFLKMLKYKLESGDEE